MGTKKEYWCDICDRRGVPDLWGLVFKTAHHFEIGPWVHTDGKHICRDCLRAMVTQGQAVLAGKPASAV